MSSVRVTLCRAGLSAAWPDDAARRALTTLTGDPDLEDFELARALFIDTETTGLAGGTGTYAFLIGCGWLEDGALRVEQYFMRDHADEPAMMAHLAHLISRFDWTVSFNGKSFDLPLLRTRFIMNRTRTALDALGALDLLARRAPLVAPPGSRAVILAPSSARSSALSESSTCPATKSQTSTFAISAPATPASWCR